MNVGVLIPAYNPSDELPSFVERLAAAGFPVVIVVNDGSDTRYDGVFDKLQGIERVVALKHPVNLGKGAALKTGLRSACSKYDGLVGVVTADADGQHTVDDVLKVARALENNPGSLVIGTRDFGEGVPLRSKVGNVCTRVLFRLLIGKRIYDTQSGLRGIPLRFGFKLLAADKNRYEFELEMLLAAKHSNLRIIQEPIQTIYIEGNKSSHFRVFADSMKIYFVLFRFLLSSLMTAAVDYLTFIITFSITSNILMSLCLARLIALIINYLAVKKFVFLSDQKHWLVFPKFLALVCFNAAIAYFMIKYLIAVFSVHVITAKVIAEGSIYFANFIIQRDLIFSGKRRMLDVNGILSSKDALDPARADSLLPLEWKS